MKKDQIIKTIEEKFKGKCVDPSGDCVYRNDNGRMCAIGLFIPDGHASLRDDFTGDVDDLLLFYPDLVNAMPSLNRKFLNEFQCAHDNLYKYSSIEEQKEILINFVKQSVTVI